MSTMEENLTENEPITIESLPVHVLEEILSRLDCKEISRLALVNKSFRDIVYNLRDPWASICTNELGITGPGLDGSWYRSMVRLLTAAGSTSSAAHVAWAWAKLDTWLTTHAPRIKASLNPGATDAALDEVSNVLGLELDDHFRALYKVHDGQNTEVDRLVDASQNIGLHPSIFDGVFGGYSFYENLTVTRLLPLSRVLRYSRMLRDNNVVPRNSTRIVFAASWNFSRLFLYDTAEGAVYVTVANKRQTLPAGPPGPRGLTLWFEEFVRRVWEGVYEAGRILPELDSSVGINLFPVKHPLQSVAITNGIVVKASAVFAPEVSIPQPIPTKRYMFAYSIRFSLRGPEPEGVSDSATRGSAAGPPVTKCQLMSRHWIIRDDMGIVNGEVRGEGVIGDYPVLQPGEPEYVYQSCTHQTTTRGTMEGDFTFVRGTISHPDATGDNVEAQCARFALDVPEFIY